MLRRKEYYVDLTDPDRDLLHQKRVETEEDEQGNLFSSEVHGEDGMHVPTLDIDKINVEVLESTTPGNYHLYIDKPITWDLYMELLMVLAKCGICQEGFVGLSIARGASFLRQPHVKKRPEDAVDS